MTAAEARRLLGLLLAILVGVGVAIQARINGALAARIDGGVAAATLSFLGGWLILLVALALLPRMRCGLRGVFRAVRGGALRPWQLLGGICGAYLVTTQGLTVGVLGVAVFTVAVVAGQSTSGLLVDRAGVGPGAARPVTAARSVGAALTLAAVLLSVSDRLSAPAAIELAVLPLLAGAAVSWQQAVNARVSEAAGAAAGGIVGAALPAALVNFSVGLLVLPPAAALEALTRGVPGPLPAAPWLYLGGPIGIVFITTAAVVVRLTGVLLFALGAIGGQLVGSVLLDLLVPAAGQRLDVVTVAGAGLAMVAVAVALLGSPRNSAG